MLKELSKLRLAYTLYSEYIYPKIIQTAEALIFHNFSIDFLTFALTCLPTVVGSCNAKQVKLQNY